MGSLDVRLGRSQIGEDKINQQIKLADGRTLGYSEFGASDGRPIFYFHGHPGSRLDWPGMIDDDCASELNARIIAIDRPGHGLSSFKAKRKILDWPDDVVELAEVLKLDRFAVLGISGGGPYAAVCAFKIPERLTATAIVSGMGPPESPGLKDGLAWTFAGKASMTRSFVLKLMSISLRKDRDRVISEIQKLMEGPDKDLIKEKPELVDGIVDTFSEAFSDGIAGVSLEAGLYKRSWGFQLQDISTEIHLWHGNQDNNILVSVGHYVADAIPNCQARFIEGAGHLTVINKCVREYLSVLVV